MQYKIKFQKDPDIAYIQFFGDVDLADLKSCYREFLDSPEFRYNIDCCFDFEQSIVHASLPDIQAYFTFAAERRDIRGTDFKLAFVYGDKMNRVLADFYRLRVASTKIDVKLFPTLAPAINWLRIEQLA